MEEPKKSRNKGTRTRLCIQFLVLLLHTVHCQETIYSDIIDHPRECNFTKLMCNESRLLEEDKIIILNIANEMRNRVAEGSFSYLNLRHDPVSNMNKLSWNQELEKKAALIVSSCPETSPSFISQETSILPGLDGIDYIKITASSDPLPHKKNSEMPGCDISTITYTEKLTLCAPQKIKERLIGYLTEGGLGAEARKYDLRDFWIITRFGEPRLTYRRHESTDIGCSYLIRAGKTHYFSYLTCIHCVYNETLPIIGHPGDECNENFQHFDEKYENLCSDLKNEYESIKKDQNFVTCKAANDATTTTKYNKAETNEVSDPGKTTTNLFKNSTCTIEFSNLTRYIPAANDFKTTDIYEEAKTNKNASDLGKSTLDLTFKNSTCTIEFSNLTRIMPITSSSSNKTIQYPTLTTLQSITKLNDITSVANGTSFKKSSEFGSKPLSTLVGSSVKFITSSYPSSTTCRKTTSISNANQFNSTLTMILLPTKNQTSTSKETETILNTKGSTITHSTTCRKTTHKTVKTLNITTTPMITLTTTTPGTLTIKQENHTTSRITSTPIIPISTVRITPFTTAVEPRSDTTPTMTSTSTTPKSITIRTTTLSTTVESKSETPHMTLPSITPKSSTIRTTLPDGVESESRTPIITKTQTTCRKTIQSKSREKLKISKTTPMSKTVIPFVSTVKPKNHISLMTLSTVASTRITPFTTHVKLQSDTSSKKKTIKVTPTTCRKTTRVINTETSNITTTTPISRTTLPFTTTAEPQNRTIPITVITITLMSTIKTPLTTSDEPQSGITPPTMTSTTHVTSTMHHKSTCRKTTKTSTITFSASEMKTILPTNSIVKAVTSTQTYPPVNDTTSLIYQSGYVSANTTFIAPKITSTHYITKNISSAPPIVSKSIHTVPQNINSTSRVINWSKISKITLPTSKTALSINSTVEAVTSIPIYSTVENITSTLQNTSSILQIGHVSCNTKSVVPKIASTHPTTSNNSSTQWIITTPLLITNKSQNITGSYKPTSIPSNSSLTNSTIKWKKANTTSTFSLSVSDITLSTSFSVQSNEALQPIKQTSTYSTLDNTTSTSWKTTSILLMGHASSDTTSITPKIGLTHPTTEKISSTLSKITKLLPITITFHKTAKSCMPTSTLKSSSTYSSKMNKTSSIPLAKITTLLPITTIWNITSHITQETTTKQKTPPTTPTIIATTFKSTAKDIKSTANISFEQKSEITTPTMSSTPTQTILKTTVPIPSTTQAGFRATTQPITSAQASSTTVIQPKILPKQSITTRPTPKIITEAISSTLISTTTQLATSLMPNTNATIQTSLKIITQPTSSTSVITTQPTTLFMLNTTTQITANVSTKTTTTTTLVPTTLPLFTTKIISITPKPKLSSESSKIVKNETTTVVLLMTKSNTTLYSPKMPCKNVTLIVTTTTPMAKKSTLTTIQNITSKATVSSTNIGSTSLFSTKKIKLATNCKKKSSTTKRTSQILNTTIPFTSTTVRNISQTTYKSIMLSDKTIDIKNIRTYTTKLTPTEMKIGTIRLFRNKSTAFVTATQMESAIKNITPWTTASSEEIPKSTTILSSTINAMKSPDENQKTVTSSSTASDKTSIQPVNTTSYNIASHSTEYIATKDIRNITSKVTESNVTILQLITMSKASKKTLSSSNSFDLDENVQETTVPLHNQTKSTLNTTTTKIPPSFHSFTHQSTLMSISPESKSSTLIVPSLATSTKLPLANITHQMTNTFRSIKFKSSSASVIKEVSTEKSVTIKPQTPKKSILEITYSTLSSTTACPKCTVSSKIITSTQLCNPCKTTNHKKRITSETKTEGISQINTNIPVPTKPNNRQRPCICINWVVIGLIFTVAFVFAWCLLCWQRVLLF